MAASERKRRLLFATVVGAALLGAALVACTGILGIDSYKEVPCAHADVCGEPQPMYEAGDVLDEEAGLVPEADAMEAATDASLPDGVAPPDATLVWARWPMPNSVDAAAYPSLDADALGECQPAFRTVLP